MANYAEELAYWYLRLNGFFPMTNFVYHRLPYVENGRTYNADADILAIRPPHYKETISSGEDERDLISDTWLDEFDGKWVGLIGEVKGSKSIQLADIERAFSAERLRVAVMRLGLLPVVMIDDVVSDLGEANSCGFGRNNEIVFLKVLFADTPTHHQDVMNSHLWLTTSLHEMDAFIRQRIHQFANPKFGGRYFFSSSFFQYLVWQERPEHFDD